MQIAKSRQAVADNLNQSVVDELREIIGRKEECRKKVRSFA